MPFPISSIVNVQISRESQSVTEVGFSTPLILSTDATVFGSEFVREYLSLTEVAQDISTSSQTYLAAAAIFSASPRVEKLKIGRQLSFVSQQTTLTFNADFVASNSIATTVAGHAITQAFSVDHTTTLAALATQINALSEVSASVTAARVITITSATAGISFTVVNPVVTSGASQATCVTVNTVENVGVVEALTSISEEDDDWYGLIWTNRTQIQVEAAAAYIETQLKIFATCSDDADILDDTVSTDIASVLQSANYTRTFVIYNGDVDNYADAAWMGKGLTYEPGLATWKFKTLVGPTADNLTSSERASAKGKNANTYEMGGGVSMTSEGTVASGLFIDEIRDVDWMTARITERVFSLLVNVPKVPFTDAGIGLIGNQVQSVLENAEQNSILASDPKYTVTVPKALDVPFNDRANRHLPNVSFTARLAGAIHSVEVNGVVTV